MEFFGRQVGPYKIIQEIGRGGMATIYLATDTRTNQRIALKILLPQYVNDPITLRRFRQEGENSKRLRHPNIIKVFEAGTADGVHYMAMEYVSGGTLAQLLKQKGRPLVVEEAVPILHRVAAALDYAHSRNILHRDVKPSNVLISESGQILLSDFGVARQIASDATVVTTVGFSVGTPSYMSPEQAQGDYDLTPRSDIYSLGVVAYAMLTSALPFDAESQLVLLRKIIDDPPISPDVHNPQLSAGVSYALQRVLAKDPEKRYTTAGEFVNGLEKGITWQPTARDWSTLVNSGAAKATQSTPVYAVLPPSDRRNRSGTMAVLLGMVAVLLAAFALFRPNIRSYLLAVGIPASVAVLLPDEPQPSTAPRPETPVGTVTIPATETPTHVPTDTETATAMPELPTATATPVIIQMVLEPFEDQNLNVRLNRPQNWRPSHLNSALYFESPDHLALFFIDRLSQTLETLTAQEAIERYLAEANTPFSSLQLTSEMQTVHSATIIAEQIYDGVLIGGAQTIVRLSLIQHEENLYLLGSSTVPTNAATSESIFKAIVDSIVFLAEPTATFTEPEIFTPTSVDISTATATYTLLPPPTETPTASATATGRPTSTPMPTDTATATPMPTTVSTSTPSITPNLTATEHAQLDIISTHVAETLTALPSATSLPTATGTDMPKPTNTSTPLATHTPTKSPTETHTSIPPETATLPQPAVTLSANDATMTAVAATAIPATVTLIPTAITVTPPQSGLISGFEPLGIWQRGDEPYGQFSQSQTQVYEGNYSGELAYDIALNSGDRDYVVFLAQSPLRIPNDTSGLEMQVYGDNSGNFLNIWVGDSMGQLYQFSFGRIQHIGWQVMWISFDLNQAWPNGPISPATITQLTPPLTVEAFVLDHHPDSSFFKSNIYFDALRGITDGASAPSSSQPAPAQPANGSQSDQATATSAPAAAPAPIGRLQGKLAVPVFNGTNMDTMIYNVADGSILARYSNRRQPDYGKCGGILLANGDGGGTNNIVRIFPDGSTRNVTANIEDAWPQWSPSCQSATYASTKQGDGRWRIYWQVDASDAFDVPPMKHKEVDLQGRYTVYLDNWRIAFNGCNYWASGSNCGIYTTDTSGGQPGHTTDQPSDIPSDALRNRILFYSQRSGNWDVWIVNFDGSGLQQLSNSPAVDGLATASPDSQYIAFLTNRDGNWAIYVMNVDGSNQQKLFNVDGGYGGGDYDWSQERLSWGE